MTDLIPINFDSQFPVNGRDLHMKLEIATPYHKCIPRMIDYGFTEGTDFNTDKNVQVQIEGTREVKREIIDHK